jgi:hypothetical protein
LRTGVSIACCSTGSFKPFQQPERVVGFFDTYRNQYPVSRDLLRDIANQCHNWVKNRSLSWGAPILEAPRQDRDKFVDPYFRSVKPDQIVVILKSREPARILMAIGKKAENRWHLQFAQRWVLHYNFYSTTASGVACSSACVRTFPSPRASA